LIESGIQNKRFQSLAKRVLAYVITIHLTSVGHRQKGGEEIEKGLNSVMPSAEVKTASLGKNAPHKGITQFSPNKS